MNPDGRTIMKEIELTIFDEWEAEHVEKNS
jgi:hypothetical protein